MARLDRQQVYQFFDIFKNNNELTEIRLIGSNKTASGYFTNADALIEAIEPYTEAYNVYFTLNKINPACYGREQKDKIILKPKNTTTDSEVIGRDWVLIDLDAKRLTGVCATSEEATRAYNKGKEVHKFLINNGFYEPIVVFSSSGIHLYLRCALINNDENTKLIKRFLEALAMLFSDEYVDVDTKVFNPARISRLMGSYSCKGANNDPTRPQRKCRFLKIPDEIKVNEKEYFAKIASLYPEDVKPTRENHYSVEKFDLDKFLEKHNIKVVRIDSISGGKKYILEHCLFNDSHTGKDAVIFQRDTGEIAYHCFHQSCSQYSWKDVRLKYEPDAYSRKEYNEFQFKQKRYCAPQEAFTPQDESEEKGKKWLPMSDIKRVDITELLSIPTGYDLLDKKIVGLFAGELTVLSGLNASGKTSWLDCLALNVIQRGFKVGVWSGEMQDWRFQSWINQIAAGKTYAKKKEGYDNLYYIPTKYSEMINSWLDDKLFLYNNAYGSKWEQLFHDIKELVETQGVQLIIIDNLAALSISGYDGEKYSKQTQFVIDVKDYAKQKNIHVILVCHPRKESSFLRKESISGTADLTNIADNVFLLHRVGKDFETRAGDFFGKDKAGEYMQFGNVLEVAKNRQFGVVDHLVGMYYEIESRRLKNDIAEHIVYGWSNEQSVYQTQDENQHTMPFGEFNSEECPF
jgi:archaellum biogenesis ATPase FlaH